MIKNVIFDMDGVLLDSEYCIRVASMQMFREKYNLEVQHEDFIPFTGMGENRFVGGVAEKYGLTFTPEMKEEAYRIYDQIAEEHVIVYEGIKELVMTLKEKGYKTAVASAADATKVYINLRCMQLKPEDFDALITGSDVTRHKPDPECFLAAAGKIGAKPEESVVIEDAVAGCKAAVAAGMKAIGVTSSFESGVLKEAGASETVAKTVDILPILDRWNSQ